MKTFRIFMICVICIFACRQGFSQAAHVKKVTLQDAIKQATDRNPDIKSAILQVKLQQKLKKTGWDLGKTNLMFEYGQSNSMEHDNNFNVSQEFSFPATYINQVKLAKSELSGAKIQSGLTCIDVVSRVRMCYNKILFLKTLYKLYKYQDSLYTDLLKAANLNAVHGAGTSLEAASAKSKLMEVKALVQQTLYDIEIFKVMLKSLLVESEEVAPADSVIYKLEFNLASNNFSLKDHAYNRLAEQQLEAGKINRNIEVSKLFPDFSIGYFNMSNKDLSPAYRFKGIQVGISAPLWFIPQMARVKAAKINVEIAENNLEKNTGIVNTQYQQLMQGFLKNQTMVDYYESAALPMAEMIIEQADKSYRSGEINYVDYIFNMDKAFDIKSSYLQSLQDYNESVIAIESFLNTKN